MLRFKILASTIPLALMAFLARGHLAPGGQPCIPVGETNLQIATAPWQAQSTISFTEDPARATVRVQIVDNAADADFTVLDDADTNELDASCPITAATRFIGIVKTTTGSEPVIYLSSDTNAAGDADYRIYVNSRSFTPREAAALIVGARGNNHPRMAAASL